MLKKIIIGNWKMNPSTLKEAEKLFTDIAKNISNIKKTDIVVCAPFIYLEKLKKLSLGRSTATGEAKKISLGAQDAFWDETGPYTGEVSGEMLYDIGARYVLLGHSERRAMGENDREVNKKIRSSLQAGLRPILCIGENVRDENHGYFSLVKNQLEECLYGVSKNSIAKIIIAYEPVWAISSTPGHKDAMPDDSREMVIFIRKILSDKFGPEAHRTRIIYGGSANEKDAEEFLKNGGVDGLLPGRASLDAKKFVQIIKICETLSN